METEAQRKAKLQQTKSKFAEIVAANPKLRVAGMGVRAIAREGIGSIPDFASAIGNLALLGTNKLTGIESIQPKIPYLSDYIEKKFDTLTDNQFVPETLGEKMADRAAGFVTGAGVLNKGVKGLAKGGVKLGDRLSRFLTTKGAKEYAATAGAGAGLEYGRDAADEDSALLPIATSLIGGYAGGKIPNLGKNLGKAIVKPAQLLGEALAINPEKVQAFKEAGLTPTLSNISDSNIVGMSENILKNTPFAADAIQDSIKATQEKIAQYGEGLTRQQSGELAETALENWRKRGRKISEKLQADLESKIPETAPITLNKTLEIADDKRVPFTETGKRLKSDTSPAQAINDMKAMLNDVKTIISNTFDKGLDLNGNPIKDIQGEKELRLLNNSIDKLKTGKALPYRDAVILREAIDSAITTFNPYVPKKDPQRTMLTQLRNKIQEDIFDSLNEVSPEAAKANSRFNNFYHKYAKKRDDIVDPLLNKDNATEIFSSIVNNTNVDAGKLKALQSTLKPAQKEVFTESLIKEMGLTPQNEFNASTLATRFKKLDPEAQEIALSGLKPEDQKKFRATIKAIDAIKNTASTGNTSRTAYTSGIAATAKDVITKPIRTAVILATGALSSSGLFTNPSFLNWISKAQKITDPSKLEKSLGFLDRLAKESPQFAPDIIQYKMKFNELQNDEELRNDTLQWDQEEFERLNAKYGNDSNVVPDQAEPQLGEATEGMQVNAPEPQGMTNEPEQDVEWDQEEWERLNAKYGNKESTTKVDDALIDKIAQVESGGNANAKAKTSTASGVLQFTDNTWREGVKKYGNELGITMRDKANPKAQKAIAAKMLEDNAQDLQTFLNRDPTESEIYLTHFLGLEGAKKLLRSPPSELAAKAFPAAAKANKNIFFKNGKALTNRQLIAMLENKITKA